MKKSFIFFISFAVVFTSLYMYVKTRKVSLDSYTKITIKYQPNDTITNDREKRYVFNIDDSLMNVFSENLNFENIEKFKFYDENFYQYILKEINKSNELNITGIDSTSFNITTVDTLGNKQFYYLKQGNLNQLICNYFPDLK